MNIFCLRRIFRMNVLLWDVIKEWNNQGEIELSEVFYAKELLGEDIFSLLLDQLEGKLKITSEQWL